MKAGGRAPGPPARSLTRWLPPSAGGLVSQSARQQPAGQRAAEGRASDAGASFCHCSSGGCRGGHGSPGPGASGEARWRRRASGAGVGGSELSPRGRSWRPRRRRSLFVSSPPQARAGGARSTASARPRHAGGRGAGAGDAAGLRGKRRGWCWGSV